jgi:hypothetical protein
VDISQTHHIGRFPMSAHLTAKDGIHVWDLEPLNFPLRFFGEGAIIAIRLKTTSFMLPVCHNDYFHLPLPHELQTLEEKTNAG